MERLILLLAVILAGECGPVQDRCEERVASVALNRVGAPGFPTSLEQVLRQGFYARGKPTDESLRVARLAVEHPEQLQDNQYYYVYSDCDRRRQGWRVGDDRICGPARLCLNFTAEWPGAE